MSGMNAVTGKRLSEDAHIAQSIRDILTTPVGSRIMRREYGSMVPELIDHPASPSNRLRLMSAAIMALLRWEPRIAVSRASIVPEMDGRTTIDLEATRRTGARAGSSLNLTVPLR